MSARTNVIPIRPTQGISAPLTIIVSETIDQGVANLVEFVQVPNLLVTTLKEYPGLSIYEVTAEIYLSIDITKVTPEELKLMVEKCRPTQIVLNNLDKRFERDYKKTTWLSLSADARNFITRIQDIALVPITLIGTSSKTMVDIR